MHLWRWNSSVWRWMRSSWSHRLSRAVRGNFTKRPALFYRNNNPSFQPEPSATSARHFRTMDTNLHIASLESKSQRSHVYAGSRWHFCKQLKGEMANLTNGMYDRLYLQNKAHVRSQSDSDTIRTKDPRRDSEIYQVNDRTCKMQNNRARPKFFHW